MTNLTRRRFVALAGTAIAATPLYAPRAIGQAKPKLVVIGGGPGGGTVARYVNKDSAGAVEVTLIEPQKNFTTCFFSNLHVGGSRLCPRWPRPSIATSASSCSRTDRACPMTA
jgi:sulfide dehydrogenase [flavocytochrome c] flavoprotein subunit